MLTITDAEFTRLAEFMKLNYGINLRPEKRVLVMTRLQNVMAQGNFDNFTSYFNYILSDTTGEAVTTLINKLTTNHTFFMREAEHFTYFKNVVLPYLSSAHADKKDLRIWSAGCSSGEEPYTLAMIMSDYFAASKGSWDTKILATDISTKVLETAMRGIYTYEDISALPDSWRKIYFRKTSPNEFSINDSIRNEVIFRRLNLNNEVFNFKRKFHVIFCRNVMIYFDAKTKNELISKYYELTEPGGYLFVGHSESLNRNETKYAYIKPAVYRKI